MLSFGIVEYLTINCFFRIPYFQTCPSSSSKSADAQRHKIWGLSENGVPPMLNGLYHVFPWLVPMKIAITGGGCGGCPPRRWPRNPPRPLRWPLGGQSPNPLPVPGGCDRGKRHGNFMTISWLSWEAAPYRCGFPQKYWK